MSNWSVDYQNKLRSAEQAVQCIRSGDGIFIHSNAAVPQSLIKAMTARKTELSGVKIYKIITLGPAPYAEADCEGSFYVHSMFIGPNIRKAVNEGRADYTPIFFSELPELFSSGAVKIDVCLLSCSKPDKEGYMTLGVSLDSTWSALKNSRQVIAEVNEQMPRTHGNTRIHIDQIDFLVETNNALPQLHNEAPDQVTMAIGRNVASLVEDEATLQMGIGGIPNAVLQLLGDKKNLGVHTEMFSDAVVNLVESGVINNSRKTVLPGKIAVSFAMGSERLYKFINDNKDVEFHGSEWINDPRIISQNHKMTAINAALQIDLTGQLCADSLGTEMYSGCGGQVDFVRGASRSPGGKAIIALESTAKGGTISRVVPTLSPGAGVVTSRADIHYVVTEYGIANLHGKNMKDRVRALIEIAHPAFREELERGAQQHKWLGKNFSLSKQ
ncbi:MAG: hypothetical protein K2X27_23530 [Candidatus Obscuribacterales bacterium]|nr:hypothetical protein [Candidatus Obscuribacterales bacterium]